ncbi:MAG: ABC transporter permease [Clostridia bacterium]|nr:ABC transporter permease [Clostridia bacterium]
MTDVKAVREPLFHVVKRSNIPVWKKLLYYAIAIVIALFLAALFCSASSDVGDIGDFFKYLFQGVVGTETRIWLFARDGMLLLGVALALLPAFKMKFWNLGANGQIIISCLVSYAVMLYLGQRAGASNAVVIIVMIVAGIAVSILWAAIPAIFKAFFNTNETLFTLMMNYIAQGLVLVMIKVWSPSGSGSLDPISNYGLIDIGNVYLLTIIVVAVLTVFSYFYLNKSKHGYELSVVGESVNTAKYAGMNVKKIVIRTMILSGLICGIIGVLLTGNINHSVHSTMHGNMGFTAIIATWLAGFNPLITIGTCFLIVFISRGMSFVKVKFHFYDESIVNVVTGFIYFFIIACSFFISYKLIFKKKSKQPQVEKNDFMVTNDEAKEENSAKDVADEIIKEKDNKTDEPVEEIIVVKEEDIKPVEKEGVKEPQKPAAKKSAGKKATAKPTGAKTAAGKQSETKATKKTVSKTATSKSTAKAKKPVAAKTKPANKGGNK